MCVISHINPYYNVINGFCHNCCNYSMSQKDLSFDERMFFNIRKKSNKKKKEKKWKCIDILKIQRN